MDPVLLAILAIAVMLAVLFARIPVSFAMLGTSFVGLLVINTPDQAVQLMSTTIYGQFSSITMVTIPLFILMGQVIFRTGMSAQLFDAAYKWFGFLPGGVAATTIATSIGFSAVSGSNAAATATMGSVALPEMKKYNYDPRLAGGSVAIGGIMGILTPPSTALIIIAVQSEQSITTLFRAALAPGLMVGAMLLVTVLIICVIRPELGPRGPRFGWKERITSLRGTVEVVVLFVLSIVGLFLGFFTPMEAAGVGALGAIVLGLITRTLTWKVLKTSVLETLRISAMVVLLVASAVVFGIFLSATRVPFELAAWVANLPLAPVVILLIVIGIYLVGGALMDAMGFLVISIPLIFPMMVTLGYDLVWFTILITLITTIGAVTPPVGINVFITAGVSPWVDTVQIFRGVMPFFIPLVIAIALLILFPGIVLFPVA